MQNQIRKFATKNPDMIFKAKKIWIFKSWVKIIYLFKLLCYVIKCFPTSCIYIASNLLYWLKINQKRVSRSERERERVDKSEKKISSTIATHAHIQIEIKINKPSKWICGARFRHQPRIGIEWLIWSIEQHASWQRPGNQKTKG